MVIKNNGKIKFSELVDKLIELDPRRFDSKETVERSIDDLTACLDFDGGHVTYNHKAKTYSELSIMERSIQIFLHRAFPDMEEKWQLYPFKHESNSEYCIMGVPWKLIQVGGKKHFGSVEKNDNYDGCDFRSEGEDCCYLGCGMDKKIVKIYSEAFSRGETAY